MYPIGVSSSIFSICSDAAGVAGNIFAFALFVSPMPTFRRIIRSKSTEEFSGLPYIYALLNCFICLWYGTPLVSPDIILVFTVNSIGAVFQLIYISIFTFYANKDKKMRMIGMLLGVLGGFGIVVFVSLRITDPHARQMFVGFLSCASLISMFASPLFIINLVIRTKSVEFMPFYLSLAAFVMSLSFLTYGIFKYDPFISVPNGVGSVLGMVQLALYTYYSNWSRENLIDPFRRTGSRTLSLPKVIKQNEQEALCKDVCDPSDAKKGHDELKLLGGPPSP